MSVLAPAHPVRWSAPEPLWDDAGPAGPQLLRLRGDRFMEELQALLADEPARLAALRATPVSHRVRPPGRDPGWEPAGRRVPLKLFGAVHGEFNLVAAALVCEVPGLPERRVRPAEGDRTAFVVRRLRDGREEAWVPGSPEGRWVGAPAEGLADGEETLPLFPLAYTDRDGRPRHLHVGLVPTTSTESWTPPPPAASEVRAEDAAAAARAAYEAELVPVVDAYRTLRDARTWVGREAHLRGAEAAVDLWLIDLADLVRRRHPATWRGADTPLARELRAARFTDDSPFDVRLREAWARRDALLGEGVPAQSLTLRLGGAAPTAEALSGWLRLAAPAPAPPAPPPTAGGGPADPRPRGPRAPKLDAGGTVEHVARCVYERPGCEPWHGPVLSAPTPRFRLAPFLDPDAPARDVHIALPIATGAKDLRQFRKSVSIALSEQLQAQMGRIGELKDVMDGKRRDGEDLGVGLVCSFSIPIITLCALVVLMVFVLLLNIVFFWLPLLRVCLPVPKRGG